MSLKEVVIVKRAVLIAAKLVVNLTPSVVHCSPKAVALGQVKFIVAIESRKINEPVFQQLKIRQFFATIVHRLECNEDIKLVADDVFIEQKAFGEFLIDTL